MILRLITSLFLSVAIICFLDLTPKQIADDLLSLTVRKESLRERARALRSGKKKKSLGERLIYTQDALNAMGKGDRFAAIVCASLLLMTGGAVLGVLINNVFLIPALSAFFAIIPFVYVRNSLAKYEKHIKEELEITLQIITTSYIRSENIMAAVKENINDIKPPLQKHFTAFLSDVTYINSDISQAIRNLRKKVDDEIFHEWCDALIQCESDSTLKDNLQPIIAKLADVRLVNSELSSMMAAVRMEYYTMVGLVVGNIPLLYVLNKDWYHTLIYELPGKITLGVCGAVIFVTYLFLLKFTKPIEYKG